MKSATLDLQRAVADLAEFDQLLRCRDEHEEKGLQEFFSARPDLLLLMPAIFMPEQTPANT